MRKVMALWLSALLILTMLPVGGAAAQSAASLAVTADKSRLDIGEEIRLTVRGLSLKDLYGYELKLSYDADKLIYRSAATGWTGFSVPLEGAGSLTFAHTKLGSTPGTNGDADMVTFVFEGLEEGEAFIELTGAKLVDRSNDAVSLTPSLRTAVEILPNLDVPSFLDVEGHWAQAAIARAAAMGIVNGYPDGSFRPDNRVTRAQFAVMLARAVDPQGGEAGAGGALPFSDAGQIGDWAREPIARAYAAGIVTGYDDGSFRPDRLVTRTEMTAMIVRALGLDTSGAPAPTFADAGLIPAWAADAVSAAAGAGVVRGKDGNRFDPLNHATRAEAATIILSMLDYEAPQTESEVTE